jgi:hypothetical protein
MATRRDQLRFDVSSDGAPNGRRRRRRPASAQRLALTRAEAAEALGISIDSFERYVQPEVRLVRRNSLRLVPVRELERWVDENAARIIEGQ